MQVIYIVLALLSVTAEAYACDYKESPPDAGRITGTSGIAEAWYGDATQRYGHGVLGDSIEAQTLYVKPSGDEGCALSFTTSNQSVFEDVTPRLADVTGDGIDDIITIESDIERGASLAIYSIVENQLQKIASTPAIGTRYRWLAPIGTADFNNDNIADVAYVETPHLGGVIKVWSFAGGAPELLASQSGYSNHRIGENYITGGVAHCNGQTQMIVPSLNWQQTYAITVTDDKIASTVVADNTTSDTIASLLRCQPAG